MGSFTSKEQASTAAALTAAAPPSTKTQLYTLDLIPGIPHEIAIGILARLPRDALLRLKLVCRTWRRALTEPHIFHIRHHLGLSQQWLYILLKDQHDNISWYSLDPLTGTWRRLPPMLPERLLEQQPTPWWYGPTAACRQKVAGFLAGLRRWGGSETEAASSQLCGCAAAALDGRLYVVGGMRRGQSAVRSTWCYDARIDGWREGAPMEMGRAYCRTTVLGGKIYAVGGVAGGGGGSAATASTPLRSIEVYDPVSDSWRRLPDIPFAGANMLPTAILQLDDAMARPVAAGAAPYGGKLLVPESLCSWPFFVDLGGEVFDPVTETWEEMPRGMAEGWPGKQSGTKISAVLDGRLYALDPVSTTSSSAATSSSTANISHGGGDGEGSGGGKIKMYDGSIDSWTDLPMGHVPVVLDSSHCESESPYLLAGIQRRLLVVTKDIHDCVVVLETDTSCLPAASGGGAAATSAGACFRPAPSVSGASADHSCAGACATWAAALEWKTVAKRRFGAVELVTCQVLAV